MDFEFKSEIPKNKVEIWTDGSCWHKTRNGGWAAMVIGDGWENTVVGSERDTTISRMEIMAAIRGLESLSGDFQVTLYSDSEYLVKSASDRIKNWMWNGWKTQAGKDVANKDLWVRLAKAMASHKITWKHVRGHSGNEFNEMVDELAGDARKELEEEGLEEMADLLDYFGDLIEPPF